MEKKQIVYKKVSELHEYENNPRDNKEAVKFVANSIKEFGFLVPIVIDSDNVVVCGHTRLYSARELELKEVPCIIADDLSEEEIKAFRLADNKVGEIASWDIEKLDLELANIDFDMSEFGFEFSGGEFEDEEPPMMPQEQEYCVVVEGDTVEDVSEIYRKLQQAGLECHIAPYDKKLHKEEEF